MTVWEWVRILTDEDSFLELKSGIDCGVICGLATVCRRPISLIVAQDGMGSKDAFVRMEHLLDKTLSTGVPLLLVLDCKNECPTMKMILPVLQKIVRLSGVCPLIGYVHGERNSLSDEIMPYMDFVLYDSETQQKNAAEIMSVDCAAAVEKIRSMLCLLPSNCAEASPLLDIGGNTKATGKPNIRTSCEEMLGLISDPNTLCSIYRELHTRADLARMGGRTVGIISCSGEEFPSCVSRFIRFCDAFSLPVIYIAEQVERLSPQIMFETARATVPKLCIGQTCGMEGLFDLLLPMDETSPEKGNSNENGMLLDPRGTVIKALEYLSVKRDVMPPHKHGNAPQ